MSRFDPMPTILAYRDAYIRANGECPYIVTYTKGWFEFRNFDGRYPFRKRRADVETMTATLLSRVKA